MKDVLYYTALHIRFGSLFYSTQLVDLFSYELPTKKINEEDFQKNPSFYYTESYLVYNFHNIMFQDRYFFFAIDSSDPKKGSKVNSISEIFPNTSWLEREVSELNGVLFNNKKDLRNLMLQYGDTSVPFQKSAPQDEWF